MMPSNTNMPISRLKVIVFIALGAVLLGVWLLAPGHPATVRAEEGYPPAPTEAPSSGYPISTDTPPTNGSQPTDVAPSNPTNGSQPTEAPPSGPADGGQPTEVPPGANPVIGHNPGAPGQGNITSNLPPQQKTRATDPINTQTYSVQPGDTLYRIALRAGISVQALMAANGWHTTIIRPGQAVIIPGGSAASNTPGASQGNGQSGLPAQLKTRQTDPITVKDYSVQAGDTLFRIALRAGTTVQALMAANHLTGYTIRLGQVLVIP